MTDQPPEKIYLQWLDDDGEVAEEVTWCEDMILDTDTKYIRADLVDALRAEVARLRGLANDILLFIEKHGSRELKAHATTLLDFRMKLRR